MNDSSLHRLGGLCSILLGISYILVGAIFLMLPADQRAGADEAAYYTSIAQNPGMVNAYYLMFVLSGILGLGAATASGMSSASCSSCIPAPTTAS